MPTPNAETVFVIGATSSLAQALCRELAGRGYGLILGGRDSNELALLSGDIAARFQVHTEVCQFDLLDAHFSPQHIIDSAPSFDHIIIATGDMGNNDSQDLDNIAVTAHVNYTLPAQIATSAAVRLSNNGKGSITIIGSVAGDRGRQSNYAYGSAKAGLATFASGLRNYYFSRGVHVMTVKPGFVDTPMTWGMKSPLIASREAVANAIVKAMLKKKDVIYVPFFWQLIMLIICNIPEKIFKKLKL